MNEFKNQCKHIMEWMEVIQTTKFKTFCTSAIANQHHVIDHAHARYIYSLTPFNYCLNMEFETKLIISMGHISTISISKLLYK